MGSALFSLGWMMAIPRVPLIVDSAIAPGQKHVVLERIDLRGSFFETPPSARGIEIAGAKVDFVDSVVKWSASGLTVHSNADVFIDSASSIEYNIATDSDLGGGITCGLPPSFPALGTTVRIAGSVIWNESTRGAGVLAQTGCEVVLLPWSVHLFE